MAPARSPCPAWSPAWKKRIAATPECRGRNWSAPSVELAGEGLLVDWWTTLMIASCAGGLAALPRERRRLSQGWPAAERAMGHQVRRPHAAGQAEGDDGAARRARSARFLPGRSRAQHRRRHPGRRRRAVGRRPRRFPRASARAAGNSLSRRQGFATPELTAGPTLAHTLRPAAAEAEARRAATGCGGLHRLRIGAAIGLSRTALQDMGDADGRRALGAEALAPACTTHFSAVDRDGNMAAVTQTLLSTFGSKFVTPRPASP